VGTRELKKPVDFDELYPGRFLKAGELQGKQATLTIQSVDIDELEGDTGKKVKGVISFEKTAKQLCLNKTNGLCIRAMFGRKLADWVGKRITLFPSQWNGEDCIRIWGSPDISQDEEITVQLPRKRPIKMTMHRVNRPTAVAPPPGPEEREPGDDL
jgi:hypothetical protein